jgi:hypothetical protein
MSDDEAREAFWALIERHDPNIYNDTLVRLSMQRWAANLAMTLTLAVSGRTGRSPADESLDVCFTPKSGH